MRFRVGILASLRHHAVGTMCGVTVARLRRIFTGLPPNAAVLACCGDAMTHHSQNTVSIMLVV